jgi:hypothetical protein
MMAQPGLGKIPLPPRPSFTALVLLASQSEKIEETLCVSLRMLEERRKSAANMLRRKRALKANSRTPKERRRPLFTSSGSDPCCWRARLDRA